MRRVIGPMVVGFVTATAAGQSIVPPPLSSLSGRVLDASGQPQRGEIELYQSSSLDGHRVLHAACFTGTDPSGSFTCKHLEGGEYFVVAHPYKAIASPIVGQGSYETDGLYFYPGVTDLSQAETVKVLPGGSALCDMQLKSAALYSISGELWSIPATAVFRLAAIDGELAIQTEIRVAYSSEEKRFLARNVPPGRYVVSAEWSSNGERKIADATVEVGDHDVLNLVLLPKEFVRLDGSLLMPPQVQVQGLALYSAEDGYRFSAPVHDGRFTFPSVPRGTYYIGLPGGTNAYIDTVALDNQESQYSRLTINDRHASHTLLLSLKQTRTVVQGTLHGWSDDHPSVQMVLVSEDTGQAFTVSAKQNGTFTFSNVRAGQYLLFAWRKSADALYRDQAFLFRHQAQGTSVSVGEEQAATADVDVLDQ